MRTGAPAAASAADDDGAVDGVLVPVVKGVVEATVEEDGSVCAVVEDADEEEVAGGAVEPPGSIAAVAAVAAAAAAVSSLTAAFAAAIAATAGSNTPDGTRINGDGGSKGTCSDESPPSLLFNGVPIDVGAGGLAGVLTDAAADATAAAAVDFSVCRVHLNMPLLDGGKHATRKRCHCNASAPSSLFIL